VALGRAWFSFELQGAAFGVGAQRLRHFLDQAARARIIGQRLPIGVEHEVAIEKLLAFLHLAREHAPQVVARPDHVRREDQHQVGFLDLRGANHARLHVSASQAAHVGPALEYPLHAFLI
jgi:hypothetical protein